MNGLPGIRASDAERDAAVGLLREHLAEGRLTLAEFTERMTAAYGATTTAELARLARDLPMPATASRRAPTLFLLSLFGSVEREGRLRIRERVLSLTLFGNTDLDLRQASLEGDVVTIVTVCAFGAADVYVPEGVEVDLHGLALFGHKRARGNDLPARAGTPLVRVFALSLFAGVDVWRVPVEWAERTLRQIIRGIAKGEHRELRA
jgi:uncharacterized protein DUF1707